METAWLVPAQVALHALVWGAGRVHPFPAFVSVPLCASTAYVIGVNCGLEEWQAGLLALGVFVVTLLAQCLLFNPVGLALVLYVAAYQLSDSFGVEVQWITGASAATLGVMGVLAYVCWTQVIGQQVEWWVVTIQTSLVGIAIPTRALICLCWLPPFDRYVFLLSGPFWLIRRAWLYPGEAVEEPKVKGFQVLV